MIEPQVLPRRAITGMSAILLPFQNTTTVDWPGFETHVTATLQSGLTPAINMDTGYANLIDEDTRQETLDRTARIADGASFVGGVFVADQEGAALNLDAYRRGVEQVQASGGTPILFQSFGLTGGQDHEILAGYQAIAAHCDRFYAFELGNMFAPFGKIYSLDLYEQLLGIANCIGAKHSSLDRVLEWERLQVRDRVRPDFKVLTGNDLAIDMVMYGSDYLLGLSTFCPEAFSLRDRYWLQGDPRFYALNDLLQYLGAFAFRAPVPAYKHSAAMFLHHRERIATDRTHPNSPPRPDSDKEILSLISDDLDRFLAQANS